MNVKQYPELNEVETQSPELPSVDCIATASFYSYGAFLEA